MTLQRDGKPTEVTQNILFRKLQAGQKNTLPEKVIKKMYKKPCTHRSGFLRYDIFLKKWNLTQQTTQQDQCDKTTFHVFRSLPSQRL